MAKKENENINKANSELKRLEMSSEDKELYDLRIKAIRDEMNIRESGYIDGMKAGKTEGIKEGIKENKKETAKAMLKENIDIALISRVTGLSQEEIENLK